MLEFNRSPEQYDDTGATKRDDLRESTIKSCSGARAIVGDESSGALVANRAEQRGLE